MSGLRTLVFIFNKYTPKTNRKQIIKYKSEKSECVNYNKQPKNGASEVYQIFWFIHRP